MNFYKTTAAFGVTACLLMATSAYGTSIESENFEGSLTAGEGWLATGNDASQATLDSAIAAPAPAGFPTGAASSTKVLSISGSATRTYSGADTDPFVDMMVKVSVPDEALPALATGTGGDAEGAKFAVAVGSDGRFKFWNASLATPAWEDVSSTVYEADAWVRVTMKFDYTNNKCTVALNGNTCDTYDLIGAASTLASVQIKGDTAIDEVVVAQGSVPAFADNSAKPDGRVATKKWLTENDIPWSSASAILDSQYALGVAADATATTAATLPLSFVQDATTGKATLSFPGLGAYGGAGTYVLQSKTTGDWSGDTVVAAGASGVTTTQVDLPSTLTYYRIVPTAPAAPASGN